MQKSLRKASLRDEKIRPSRLIWRILCISFFLFTWGAEVQAQKKVI